MLLKQLANMNKNDSKSRGLQLRWEATPGGEKQKKLRGTRVFQITLRGGG